MTEASTIGICCGESLGLQPRIAWKHLFHGSIALVHSALETSLKLSEWSSHAELWTPLDLQQRPSTETEDNINDNTKIYNLHYNTKIVHAKLIQTQVSHSVISCHKISRQWWTHVTWCYMILAVFYVHWVRHQVAVQTLHDPEQRRTHMRVCGNDATPWVETAWTFAQKDCK